MLHWVHVVRQTESNQASMGVWKSLILCQDILLKAQNVVIRSHPLGTMNVFPKCNGNPSDCCFTFMWLILLFLSETSFLLAETAIPKNYMHI